MSETVLAQLNGYTQGSQLLGTGFHLLIPFAVANDNMSGPARAQQTRRGHPAAAHAQHGHFGSFHSYCAT
jgi:hypothetical protein